MGKQKRYSIIIGTLNHLEDCLKPCLEAIIKYTDLEQCEVIVVANGCTDGTRKYVESLGDPFKLLWFDEPLGYSRANNEGIRVAQGEYIVLLNNDAFLLEQPKNQWLDMLEEPFKNPWNGCGISGPLKGWSEPAGHNFVVFFCAMIHKDVFTRTGLLDEQFGVGGGEDTALCIDAERFGYKVMQVPGPTEHNGNLVVGGFPIYHKGEATMHDNPKWQEIFDRNSEILRLKYNEGYKKWKLSNNCERAVIDAKEDFTRYGREYTRYKWASENMTGKKVLEIGCSSGYGTRMLPKDIEYTGYDYADYIVEYARSQFPQHKFEVHDLEKEKIEGFWDTIIAFEVLEHLENGKELAQELKNHCNTLLCTVPYREIPGLWGQHHKMHHLEQKHFPGFDYIYVSEDGLLIFEPERFDGMNLLLMKWSR